MAHSRYTARDCRNSRNGLFPYKRFPHPFRAREFFLRAFSYCPCMKNVNEKLDATAAAMKKLLPAQDILQFSFF